MPCVQTLRRGRVGIGAILAIGVLALADEPSPVLDGVGVTAFGGYVAAGVG